MVSSLLVFSSRTACGPQIRSARCRRRLTVRDGIGKVIDRTIDPMTYLVPLIPALSLMAGNRVNERALNYELFAAFDDDVIDAYSAVRNGFLRLRARRVNERPNKWPFTIVAALAALASLWIGGG